jgi:hypothetical protein
MSDITAKYDPSQTPAENVSQVMQAGEAQQVVTDALDAMQALSGCLRSRAYADIDWPEIERIMNGPLSRVLLFLKDFAHRQTML